MEKILAEDAGVKTLEPSILLEFPRFRRSHLKSATFRTLVRILTYCLDESSLESSPKPGTDSNPSPLSESQLLRISNQEQYPSSSLHQDQTTFRNPKPINPQIELFRENVIPCKELGQITRQEAPDQLVELGGGDELLQNARSVGDVLEPVGLSYQIGIFSEKRIPCEKLGQITGQETPDQLVKVGGNDESGGRNACSVSEVLKSVCSSTQIESFYEKRIAFEKLGQITRQETPDQLVKPVNFAMREVPDEAKSMSIDNVDSSFCLERSIVEELGQEMNQQHRIDVESSDRFETISDFSGLNSFDEGIVSEHINGSFRMVVTDRDVEDSQSTMDESPKSGENRNNSSCSERIVAEELGLEREQEGLDMKISECTNNVAHSSMLRNLSEAVIDEQINNTVSVVTDLEIEDGEILDELGDSCKSSDLHAEHVSDELNKEDKYSSTYMEQKRAEENEMAFASSLVDTLGFTGNRVEWNIESKKFKGMEFKFNTQSNSKTDEVKFASVDNSKFKHGEMILGDHATKGELKRPTVPSHVLGLAREITEKVVNQDQGKISTVKEGNVREKKKKAPLTEERRAKKKLTKKRKRAEMNKKLGVKRLKLLPIVKPQKVNYCNFYLKGRCQQGNTCKFSHDTTPLTKSQPCKYFATQSCLKGEDCPFDHDLSKYPCHNYMSNGSCSRGSGCKFSHKIPHSEVSSVTSNVSAQESPLLPNVINSTKTTNIGWTPCVAVKNLFKDPTLRTPFSMKPHLDRHTVEPLAEVRRKPPEGITFLSFGQVPVGETSKQQQDNSFSKKNDSLKAGDQQNQASSEKLRNSTEIPSTSPLSALTSHQSLKSLANGHMNSPNTAHTKLFSNLAFASKYESDMMQVRSMRSLSLKAKAENSPKGHSISDGSAAPCAGRSQSGSMDASKILEEFLFNGFVGKQ